MFLRKEAKDSERKFDYVTAYAFYAMLHNFN